MSVLGIVLLVFLVVLVIGGIPTAPWYGQPHAYGYWPSGLGLILVVLLILFIMGKM